MTPTRGNWIDKAFAQVAQKARGGTGLPKQMVSGGTRLCGRVLVRLPRIEVIELRDRYAVTILAGRHDAAIAADDGRLLSRLGQMFGEVLGDSLAGTPAQRLGDTGVHRQTNPMRALLEPAHALSSRREGCAPALAGAASQRARNGGVRFDARQAEVVWREGYVSVNLPKQGNYVEGLS